MSSRPEFAESLSTVDFDTDIRSYRATYNNTHDSTSLAVVAVVSTALDKDPLDLTPLQSVIETDSLDELAVESLGGGGSFKSISFDYEGFGVTVFGEGVIEARPTEN